MPLVFVGGSATGCGSGEAPRNVVNGVIVNRAQPVSAARKE
ncbi:hypothetical protein B7755_025475 [Streptomyces sp. NBS 14/10]|nr:hypothetical protein [Streptomyces sp. NBS 14/10]KAK1181192.1 hypothetical protein B7755_025475 [Streptomyces sp. NBS 14/10]